MEREIEEIRQEIDEIDDKIIQLLSQRNNLSKLVGDLKRKLGREIEDAARERQLFDRIHKIAHDHGVDPQLALEVYEKILAHSKKEQQ